METFEYKDLYERRRLIFVLLAVALSASNASPQVPGKTIIDQKIAQFVVAGASLSVALDKLLGQMKASGLRVPGIRLIGDDTILPLVNYSGKNVKVIDVLNELAKQTSTTYRLDGEVVEFRK